MNARTIAHPRKPITVSPLLPLFGVALALIALFGPGIQQPATYHDFADQRTLLNIPHAMDVLSNLPFLFLGVMTFIQGLRIDNPRWRGLVLTLGIGLTLTFIGSGYYHLAPSDGELLWDRAGMLVVFAAVLGMATADRLSFTSALATMMGVLMGGVLSLWHWQHSGNLLPWVVLQGGGMLLLLLLAPCRPRGDGYGFRLGACLLWYAAAKLCELWDGALFDISAGVLSGHSVKHVLAALAVLPLLLPLLRRSDRS